MNTIIMLLLISILILVHELGHFLAARFFGIKVDKFGFGLPIGPTLFKTKWGETEILIHAFLLGGYVSFPDDDKDSKLPKDSDLRFENQKIYKRALVISAGVIANVLCAYFLVMLAAGFWGKLPNGTFDVYVTKIHPEINKNIENTGLSKNDQILKINGQELKYPYELNIFAMNSKRFDGLTDSKTVNKNLEILKKMNNISDENKFIKHGTKIKLDFVTEQPIKLTEDEKIGLVKYKSKDDITLTPSLKSLRDKLKNKTHYIVDSNFNLYDISVALSDNYHPIMLTIKRENGKIIDVSNVIVNEDGLIGIEKNVKEKFNETKDLKSIIKYSNDYLKDNTLLMLNGLGKIFTGQVPLDDLHGVVAITKIGSDIIEHQGLFKGLLLTAIISLNLAIINILPIPALDGGHLLFLLIEKIKGSKVDEKIIIKISNIFFNVLIILMILVIFNDIIGLILKKF